MLWIGMAIAAAVILVGPRGVVSVIATRAAPQRQTQLTDDGSDRGVEAIWFVDGPLAGNVNHLPAGSDGLPPYQFCAIVARPDCEGGDYTMPYQRGPISEEQHAWQYTQGWSTPNSAVSKPRSEVL